MRKRYTYRDMLINDLSVVKDCRFSIIQIQSEIETLDSEYASIKATNYDKMPVGSGENLQEEKLVTVIAKKDQKLAELDMNKRFIADMERLLEQLPDDERRVIERMIVNNDKYAAADLSDELGYESAQIYRIRNKALMRLSVLRHGVAYQP